MFEAQIAYSKQGLGSNFERGDCTGILSMTYALAGMPYDGVGGATVTGNKDFNSKFRVVDLSKEKMQVGDIALWENDHVAMYDPNAPRHPQATYIATFSAWTAYNGKYFDKKLDKWVKPFTLAWHM